MFLNNFQNLSLKFQYIEIKFKENMEQFLGLVI